MSDATPGDGPNEISQAPQNRPEKPPGFFERRRLKNAAERAERDRAAAQKTYDRELAAWQQRHDGQLAALELARATNGESTTELMLKRGESVFAKITGAGLIEMRKGPGQWRSGSQGFSIPVGSLAGRSIRPGATTFSVSNRQKPRTIHYGAHLDEWFHLRLEIALAHYRGEVPALVERLESGLAAIDAEKPAAPPT